MIRVITLLILFATGFVSAQNQNPCNTDEHNQFNFWVGDWNVFNVQGKIIGTNKIVKMHNNCVMQENWESKTSANKGTSYNYYNLVDKTWNQVWVDNSGYSLVLKGNLKDDSMILTSELVTTKKGNYYNRLSWTRNDDGSVTQVWDYVNPKGKVIQETFRGIYKKK